MEIVYIFINTDIFKTVPAYVQRFMFSQELNAYSRQIA
jgi:hypothetical protein